VSSLGLSKINLFHAKFQFLDLDLVLSNFRVQVQFILIGFEYYPTASISTFYMPNLFLEPNKQTKLK